MSLVFLYNQHGLSARARPRMLPYSVSKRFSYRDSNVCSHPPSLIIQSTFLPLSLSNGSTYKNPSFVARDPTSAVGRGK